MASHGETTGSGMNNDCDGPDNDPFDDLAHLYELTDDEVLERLPRWPEWSDLVHAYARIIELQSLAKAISSCTPYQARFEGWCSATDLTDLRQLEQENDLHHVLVEVRHTSNYLAALANSWCQRESVDREDLAQDLHDQLQLFSDEDNDGF